MGTGFVADSAGYSLNNSVSPVVVVDSALAADNYPDSCFSSILATGNYSDPCCSSNLDYLIADSYSGSARLHNQSALDSLLAQNLPYSLKYQDQFLHILHKHK